MKQVLRDTAQSISFGGGGLVAVDHVGAHHPDPVAHTLQIIITVASSIGSLWPVFRAILDYRRSRQTKSNERTDRP